MRIIDDRDEFDWRNKITTEIAHLRTDVQRLWRLTARVINQPNEIVGGDVEDQTAGSGSGTDVVQPEYADDGPAIPPGGPPPNAPHGAGVPPDCCLWMHDGSQWVKIIDNTTDCVCPEPEHQGAIFDTAITCCESSNECTVPWSPCPDDPPPCNITVDIEYQGAPPSEPTFCGKYDGSYGLTWNETTSRYEDLTCRQFSVALGETLTAYISYYIVATLHSAPSKIVVRLVTFTRLDAPGPCNTSGGATQADLVADCDLIACEPLYCEGPLGSTGCPDATRVTVSE